ncbi:hypothetical protein F892_00019 [Acinetobacter vivianii]|uniref:Uncharacterized protein n=1 Tax=Acinetobacter vivianii TaxID=1776742 RepID=N9NUM0_9GAMM|nr:hypothetical protein F892_00019 [Acinetobacter vivianii]
MITSDNLYLLILPQIIISVVYAINLFDRKGWVKFVFYGSFILFFSSIIAILFKMPLIATWFFWFYFILFIYSILYGLFKIFTAKKS